MPFQVILKTTPLLKKIFLLLIVFITFESYGQTIVISPTGDGGFENGSSFLLNGWSATTGTTNPLNQWVCGTNATLGFSGINSAFIAKNSTLAHDYNISSARTSHLYRTITIPSGETQISLNFNWICVGEGAYDKMRIFIIPANVTPVYGTAITPSGAAPTGNVQIGLTNYSAQVSWTTSPTVTLPGAYAGTTVRLVFEWSNDASLGNNPPAAIDNISLISQAPIPPVISSLSSTSGCVGSSLIITGTNLLGATAVSIGGNAAAITSTTTTTITATVGSVVTGTIQVTTPSGSGTSSATFTVNPLPANPANPTSNSPQCNPPGVTLTRGAAPPGTENYYWQTVSLGTNTTNNSNTYNTTTSGTYYLRAQTIATGCWSLGQGSSAVVVNTSINSLATIPNPSNGNSGVCYSGTVAVNSISWTAAAGATSYDVYFGAGSLPGSVTSNVATTNYATGSLVASTTYYWKIVPRNACGVSTGSPTTWSFITASASCICIPTSTYTSDYISNFSTTGGNTNISNPSGGLSGTGYGDFYAIHSASLFAGNVLNFTETYNGGNHGLSIWVDLNNNGVFETTERLFNSGATATGFTGAITIPLGTVAGDYRMRVRSWWNNLNPDPCTLIAFGEAEDYKITVLPLLPCTTPTVQPTTLNLTVSGTTINGTFTAASPAPSGYLIVRSSSATAPTLTNGTTYAIGFTGLTPGVTTVIQGSAVISNMVTFSDTGLTASTQYYYHVFSYNAGCIGTPPLYLVTTPLKNNATTCIATPTAPTNSAITSNSFTVTWSASAGALNYVLEVYTNAGYTIPVAGSPFTIAGPTVTFNVTGLVGPVTYYYRIKATNASCSTGYVNGNATTLLSNDECAGAIPLPINSTCSYSTYSNTGATASTGMTVPGCGNYSGGDVWFSVVVPATGEITVDLQSGGMTDSGMAFYSGTCGALTLIECNDDDSTIFSLMSNINLTGLTPGQIIYVRVWGYGGSSGTFGICASTPSCPSPADLFSNILSTTSVTVGWTPSAAATGGYQYYINTTGTAPTAGTTPTGSTPAGVTTVTLVGLTSGLKYYFWVRSYCGGSDVSNWFGPTNYTPCAVGSGTGTTTLPCINPIAAGQGLSGADPAALVCSGSTCTNLEVTFLPIKQTTDYAVSSIPYAPPYQFTCLQNPVSVNIDDVWSSTINLPFNFCFYGNNYNKCLMGSNGVITFDTTTNSPGGYSTWSFSNNLPNNTLFKNTIFGVYHDIDPSKGGQVGWELITLNSGCRALVASWNEIPMFSAACNSSYYTGMMVLYENTNIIEVYIKEKNICASWNGGNAIVGVQNTTGTAAVVAPNRNGLDTNWTVANGTGEAWRFTPNGPSINPTVQWYQGTVATGTPIAAPAGTADVINVCPSATTTYTAEVTYPLCTGNLKVSDNTVVTVTGNKVWNGNTSNNWNTGTNWTPTGVPTNADCVIVPVVNSPRPYPILSNVPNAVGYNLAVYSNASLTIAADQNLTITDKITVQTPSTGAFTINNNANLLQINDAAVNNGKIFYKRIAPNIQGSDYVYWSSPVANQAMETIYDSSFPFSSGIKYQWNTILNNGNGANGNISQGIWEPASGIMTRARGYIIRGSSSFGMPASSIPTTFNGVPFNGIIPFTVQRGSFTGAQYNGANNTLISNLSDNYNLLGNPYPSSINALKFLKLNGYDSTNNPTGVLVGNVKLWRHGIDPLQGAPNPFYGSYQINYDANDYLTVNYLGGTVPGPVDIIKSGQAFFVQMIDITTPSTTLGTGIVNFNNDMRFDTGNLPYLNNNFFKNANTATNEISLERNRIWLAVNDYNNKSSGMLLGYATDATNNYDNFFDAQTAVLSSIKLFSMIEDDTNVYDIQGRTLPFNINDEISIGLMAPTQGNYTFAIAGVDGLFDNQNIYLKDNLLNSTHNLKTNPYTFSTISGVIRDRFKIVYIDTTLGTPDYSIDNNIKVVTNNEVAVSSSNLQMESIVVFNVLGQELNTYKNISSHFVILSNLQKNNTTLFLKIKLQTGETITKKIIF